MSVDYSNKLYFQLDKEMVRVHSQMVRSHEFQHAVAMVLAELTRYNPTREQMQGVNMFIHEFINFAEKDEDIRSPMAMPNILPPEQLTPESR